MARYEQTLHLSFNAESDEDALEAANSLTETASEAVNAASAFGVKKRTIPATHAYIEADEALPELVDEEE